MDLKDYLTNEKVSKKFRGSQFDLVNYAIRLAVNMIGTGRDTRVKIDSENRARQVLTEILNDKDQFDEIIIQVQEPAVEERAFKNTDEKKFQNPSKHTDRKKSRKALAE